MFKEFIREYMADSRARRYIRLKEQMSEIEDAVFTELTESEEMLGDINILQHEMEAHVKGLTSIKKRLETQLKTMEELFDEYEHRNG